MSRKVSNTCRATQLVMKGEKGKEAQISLSRKRLGVFHTFPMDTAARKEHGRTVLDFVCGGIGILREVAGKRIRGCSQARSTYEISNCRAGLSFYASA